MGQGDSARVFDTSESMKNAGILDVFPVFHAARLGQKIRRSPQFPLCGAAQVLFPKVMHRFSAEKRAFFSGDFFRKRGKNPARGKFSFSGEMGAENRIPADCPHHGNNIQKESHFPGKVIRIFPQKGLTPVFWYAIVINQEASFFLKKLSTKYCEKEEKCEISG